MPWKNETIVSEPQDKVNILDSSTWDKRKTAIYLDSQRLITIQEMEEALYEARTLINKLGNEEADKWLEKVFKP